MPRIAFAPTIQRCIATPALDVGAAIIAAALQTASARESCSRGCLLDDQDSLRRRMTLFIDGVQIRDRRGLDDPLQDDSEVCVVQVLSGGWPTEKDIRWADDSMLAPARACSSYGAARWASGC